MLSTAALKSKSGVERLSLRLYSLQSQKYLVPDPLQEMFADS